jgi:hypothetical protein
MIKFVFFDYTYVDTSLTTRLERQRKQIFSWLQKIIPNLPLCLVIERYEGKEIKSFNRLKKDLINHYKKLLAKLKKQSIFKEIELKEVFVNFSVLSSFDNQIKDKGAIVDQEGGLHTTVASYKDYLRKNDLVIKDWKDGSLRKQEMQLCNRDDIARTLERLIN